MRLDPSLNSDVEVLNLCFLPKFPSRSRKPAHECRQCFDGCIGVSGEAEFKVSAVTRTFPANIMYRNFVSERGNKWFEARLRKDIEIDV